MGDANFGITMRLRVVKMEPGTARLYHISAICATENEKWPGSRAGISLRVLFREATQFRVTHGAGRAFFSVDSPSCVRERYYSFWVYKVLGGFCKKKGG